MWKWIVVLLFLVLLGLLFRPKEGFQDADALRPTTFADQLNYFHYQQSPIDKPGILPVGPGIVQGPSAISLSALDQAVKTVGYSLNPASIANGISRFFNTGVADDQMADAACRGAVRPANLMGDQAFQTERARKGEGCGWWYVDNLYTPSTGAYGKAPTRNEYGVVTAPGGPTDPTIPTEYPGGRWIWDLDEADKLEHIKRCKRIQNCDLLDGTEDCAFCPSKGYAVPIDSQGQLKFPNDEEANCGSVASLVRQAADCKPLVIQPRLTNYDYDYDINGNVLKEGENSQALNQVGQTLEFVCATSPLSKACRLAMCKEVAGCTEGRGLHRIVQQDGALGETDRLALRYLSERGRIGIPETFTKTGTIEKSEALELMKRIRTAAMSSQSPITKAAARWLLDESPFDVCMYSDSDSGPFPVECLQREFRKAGCQASGSAYPSANSNFTGMTFGTIKTQFRDLYQQMTDTASMENVRDQDRAVQQCLGISVPRETTEIWARNPNLCRDPGIEYWVYSIPEVGKATLLGRMVVPQLLTTSSQTAETKALQTLLEKAKGLRGYTARTNIDVGTAATTVSLQLPTDDLYDNYKVFVNGVRATQLSNIPLVPQQRNSIVVQFEIPSGAAFGDPVLSVTPPGRLVLHQSAWKPLVSLEVRNRIFTDTNLYLPLQSAQVVTYGGRDALAINEAPNAFPLSRGLTYEVMKTVTCMLYWSTLSGQATVFQWDQGRGGTDTLLALRIIEGFPTVHIQSARGLYQFRSPLKLNTPNQWVHIGILLGTEVKMWINGVEVKDTLKKEALDTTSEYSRLVLGSPGFNGAIGWLHVYDRRLTETELARDRVFDTTSDANPPVDSL